MTGFRSIRFGNSDGGLYLPPMAGHFATTPDESGLDITGDIDIRVRSKLPQISGTRILATKYATAGNQRSWVFFVSDSSLQFRNYADGTASSSGNHASSVLTEPAAWWRVTLDVDDGDGGFLVSFFTAPDQSEMPSTWQPIGVSGDVGATSIYPSTAPLSVGNDGGGFTGTYAAQICRRIQVRDGIDGAIVADAEFAHPPTKWKANPTTMHDGYRVWTINGDRWEWRR